MTKWVQKIEQADEKGNTKEIFKGVKTLSGSTTHSSTAPTEHFEAEEQATTKKNQTPRASVTKVKINTSTDGKLKTETAETRASTEAGASTSTDGNKKAGKTDGSIPVRRASKRINGPSELVSV